MTDLSNIGTADFRITFTVTTTSAGVLMSLVEQLGACIACGEDGAGWAIAMTQGGGVHLETSDGIPEHRAFTIGGGPINDGAPHRVTAGRTDGMLWVQTDDGAASVPSPSPYGLGALPPLTLGQSPCGSLDCTYYQPLSGSVEDVCITRGSGVGAICPAGSHPSPAGGFCIDQQPALIEGTTQGPAVPYLSAVTVCESRGMRLCTQQERESSCPAGQDSSKPENQFFCNGPAATWEWSATACSNPGHCRTPCCNSVQYPCDTSACDTNLSQEASYRCCKNLEDGCPSATWSVEAVPGADGATFCALALTADDASHLVCATSSNTVLHLTRTPGGEWSSEVVGSAPPRKPQLAVDAESGLHVTYNTPDTGVTYAYRSPQGTWTIDDVGEEFGVLEGPSLALNGVGAVHLAYSGCCEARSVTKAGPSDDWSFEVVEPVPTYVSATQVATDELGGVHLAYDVPGGVRYAHRSPGGTWLAWPVVTTSGGGAPSGLAVDPTGGVHITYGGQYAHRSPEGVWTSETLGASGPLGNPILAATGAVHVLIPQPDGSLNHAWRPSLAAAWTSGVVDRVGGTEPRLALGRGVLHAVWIAASGSRFAMRQCL